MNQKMMLFGHMLGGGRFAERHHGLEFSLQGLLVKGEGLAAITIEDQVRADSKREIPLKIRHRLCTRVDAFLDTPMRSKGSAQSAQTQPQIRRTQRIFG
jgi:hypothetical protein